MYIRYNSNPINNRVGDCVVRAISKVMDKSWDDTYIAICVQGFTMYDMPDSNAVWGAYLLENGFSRYVIPNTCPNCYTVKDFCRDYPKGKYLLATGTHLIASISGNYYDTWDSGDEPIIFYWKENEHGV